MAAVRASWLRVPASGSLRTFADDFVDLHWLPLQRESEAITHLGTLPDRCIEFLLGSLQMCGGFRGQMGQCSVPSHELHVLPYSGRVPFPIPPSVLQQLHRFFHLGHVECTSPIEVQSVEELVDARGARVGKELPDVLAELHFVNRLFAALGPGGDQLLDVDPLCDKQATKAHGQGKFGFI